MNEPIWLDRGLVDEIHYEMIDRYGGAHGMLDENGLESAIVRPMNAFCYGGIESRPVLAAILAYGICATQRFRDGNKRTAFAAAYAFLGINGWDLFAEPQEAARVFLDVASKRMTEAELIAWFRDHAKPTPDA